jgi:selenocysteine-specific elongation factor
MPIVGTAGHVDHGKSTLVEALTGSDPDRWDEEKRRGLTIDLGFASADIEGVEFGFVDVPGHERFIKNMLAGVVGVDCALLVVAADSGWMPQTEEHVRVLDLIGADRGVIAMTRTDLVDSDTVELVELEIADEVAGTTLSDWPVIPVSAVTGRGLDDLRAALATIGRAVSQDNEAPFRLWVDRAFAIHGSGTVVTGTVQRGSVKVDDTIEIQPGGTTARVRGLHRHDRAVESVGQGQRAAINLSSVELEDIGRGTLLAAPGTSLSTTRFLMRAEPSRGFDKIPPKGGFHIHTGTADRPARIRRVADSLFLVTVKEPVPAICGDRVVLRESGRQAVVGGGPVLDPDPSGAVVASETTSRDLDGTVDHLVNRRGLVSVEWVRRATGGMAPTTGVAIGSLVISDDLITTTVARATDEASAYHAAHPRRPGIPIAELAGRVDLDHDIVAWIVDHADGLALSDGFVSLQTFSNDVSSEDQRAIDDALKRLNESFDVPRSSQLGLDADLLRAMIRSGDLIRIDPDLVFTAAQIDELKAGLRDLPDGFTVSEFKDHFGMARRQSVPLLEWLDKTGMTLRSGDGRTVR